MENQIKHHCYINKKENKNKKRKTKKKNKTLKCKQNRRLLTPDLGVNSRKK